jgi:hypothetical protein
MGPTCDPINSYTTHNWVIEYFVRSVSISDGLIRFDRIYRQKNVDAEWKVYREIEADNYSRTDDTSWIDESKIQCTANSITDEP